MYEILLAGIVGWDILASVIREKFRNAPQGKEIRLLIDSPGGSFREMVSIYNIIRDHARTGANVITTYIQGNAMSAGSMIALAANSVDKNNKIIVEDNSIFMIHNCWLIVMGDTVELGKCAIECERIDEQQRNIYEQRTGKNRAELTEMMKETTFLYGQEIIDEGFADELVAVKNVSKDDEGYSALRTEKVEGAQTVFASMKKQMQDDAKKHEGQENVSASFIDDIAAMFTKKNDDAKTNNANTEQTPVVGEKNNTEDSFMTKDELKQKHPELYAQIYGEGVTAGVTEERERCENHLKMAGTAGDVSAALPFIKDGKSCSDNAVASAYFEVMAKGKMKAAQVGENIGAVNAADGDDNGDGSDDNGFMAAFNKAGGYKDVKGA